MSSRNSERSAPMYNNLFADYTNYDNYFVTEAKHSFKGLQPMAQTKLDDKIKKDLRATHFKVGYDKKQYQTTSGAFFAQPVNPQKAQQVEAVKSNFRIGDLPDSDHYKTSYNLNFSKTVRLNNDKEITNLNLKNNIVLGSDKTRDRFISEAAKNYVDQKGQPGKLDEAVRKDLRAHHYLMGLDQPNYQSVTKQTYQYVRGQSAKLQQKAKEDLQAAHFTLGTDKVQYTAPKSITAQTVLPLKLKPEIDRLVKIYSQGTS